ncbi:RNA recognition motif domain-containing protein [Echinimonas agarilytica]|uniref:RNA-binding protein n=1 Tax=Echinimonas agarilytica TaxID=1215918 RepID=A0AA41W767_9GAMM|nr:RNA-binding protein [Echinimonas agarilytica]MCM2680400.1 RNA-binding protein [Echinimonas agarilytica]
MMRIYVGNLSYKMTDESLAEAFAQYGEIASANIIIDRDTQRSKGFGFVDMVDDAAAQSAIERLNGQPLDGRNVVVNEARPRASR